MHCSHCEGTLDQHGRCPHCYRRRCALCGGVLLLRQSIWLRPYGDAVHLDRAVCAQEEARRETAKTAAGAPAPPDRDGDKTEGR
jgi:hypothetical protein